ncbi:vacuolar protein sorting-associated protein 41 [Anaeramoeba flamelloides]|uniref:Vacuolar protein sorting-associated protein 41 n=1 Tax=Anaeramoeba flamelloides TaxID=1746091 RepID=A0AAV7YHI9_9EUKA|nr:vacuolar protein sorting-associated protein 41 [Anaeramoeba flamelloides]
MDQSLGFRVFGEDNENSSDSDSTDSSSSGSDTESEQSRIVKKNHEIEPQLRYKRISNDLKKIIQKELVTIVQSTTKFIILGTGEGKVYIFRPNGFFSSRYTFKAKFKTPVTQLHLRNKHLAGLSKDGKINIMNFQSKKIEEFDHMRQITCFCLAPGFGKGSTREFLFGDNLGHVYLSSKRLIGRSKTEINPVPGNGNVKIISINPAKRVIVWADQKVLIFYDQKKNKLIKLFQHPKNFSKTSRLLMPIFLIWINDWELILAWGNMIIKYKINFNENKSHNVKNEKSKSNNESKLEKEEFSKQENPNSDQIDQKNTRHLRTRHRQNGNNNDKNNNGNGKNNNNDSKNNNNPNNENNEKITKPRLKNLSVAKVTSYHFKYIISGFALLQNGNFILLTISDELVEDNFYKQLTKAKLKMLNSNLVIPEIRLLSSDDFKEIYNEQIPFINSEHMSFFNFSVDYSGDKKKILLCSGTDLILARSVDVEDRIEWLLNRERFQEALNLARSKPKKLGKFNLKEIGIQYLDYLLMKKKYKLLVKEMELICSNDKRLWEYWILVFYRIGKLKMLSNIIPIGRELNNDHNDNSTGNEEGDDSNGSGNNSKASRKKNKRIISINTKNKSKNNNHLKLYTKEVELEETIYETVLSVYMKKDVKLFRKLINIWPLSLYEPNTIIKLLEYKIKNEKSVDRTLMLSLAEIYERMDYIKKALSLYLETHKKKSFELIKDNNLFTFIHNKINLLVETDQRLAFEMLIQYYNQIPVNKVAKQLKNEIEKRPFLLKYLDRMDEIDRKLCMSSHDILFELYAEFNPEYLLDFLRSGANVSLNSALGACRKFKRHTVAVYVLWKMGNTNEALNLVMDKLGDISKAIELVQTEDDPSLWEELVQLCMKHPEHISHLLNNLVNTKINSLNIIKKIPTNKKIIGLRDSLIDTIQDEKIKTELIGVTKSIIHKDCSDLMSELHSKLTGSTEIEPNHICYVCGDPIKNFIQDKCVIFFCGHSFHQSCIAYTLESDSLLSDNTNNNRMNISKYKNSNKNFLNFGKSETDIKIEEIDEQLKQQQIHSEAIKIIAYVKPNGMVINHLNKPLNLTDYVKSNYNRKKFEKIRKKEDIENKKKRSNLARKQKILLRKKRAQQSTKRRLRKTGPPLYCVICSKRKKEIEKFKLYKD